MFLRILLIPASLCVIFFTFQFAACNARDIDLDGYVVNNISPSEVFNDQFSDIEVSIEKLPNAAASKIANLRKSNNKNALAKY